MILRIGVKKMNKLTLNREELEKIAKDLRFMMYSLDAYVSDASRDLVEYADYVRDAERSREVFTPLKESRTEHIKNGK